MCVAYQPKTDTHASSFPLFLIILLSASVLLSSALMSNTAPYFGNHESIARIFVSASAQAPSQNTTGDGGMLVYQNSTYGIKMQYPPEWNVTGFNNTAAASTKLVAGFLSPIGVQSISDRNPESVVVGVENLSSGNMGLAPYTTIQLSLLSQATQDFNLLESRPTTLANNPAHQIVYTETVGPLKLKKMQVWTVKDGTAYLIVYGADELSYPSQLPTVRRMLDSFEIINTAPKIANSTG
jgi:hypothetical protein